MSDCPLKLAARDFPNLPAIIGSDFSITYKELDLMADKITIQEGEIISFKASPSPDVIATFFGAWRKNGSIFPLNLHAPSPEIPNTKHYRSLLLYTSGSTGTPKIAILSLESLLINATYSLPLTPDDRWLLSLPLYHVGGIGIMLRCILAKAAIVLDPNQLNITHISYVPTQLYRASPIYKNLKCILLGGAPPLQIPDNLPIFGTYGLTEMGSMVLLKKNPTFLEGKLYLGDPLPKREIILAPDGEILVRGETLFQGYLGEQKVQGWFRTGDIGSRDPIHGISVIGRKDWQFISGGENIQPEEIEKFLILIPGILEAVVLPKKDPEFGARPIAIIRSEEKKISLEKVQELLLSYLPKYKIPIALIEIDDFPKKGLKIDRHKLKNLLDGSI